VADTTDENKDGTSLLGFFEVPWLPGFVEGSGSGSIDAEVTEPTFSGDGFDPLTFMPSRWFGAEI
jgi:hypothetical protein